MTGTIKTLRAEKGFGFISSEGKDYFFHHTGVASGRMEDLREGESVEFDPGANGPKGPRAENVRSTSN